MPLCRFLSWTRVYFVCLIVQQLTRDSHWFILQILSDDIPELEEEFEISLGFVTGEGVVTSPDTVTVEIEANDDQHGMIMFDSSQQSPVYINEDQPSPRAVLNVRREGGTFGEVS